MSRFVRPSKYRHVFGTTPKADEIYSNLNISKSSWDSNYASVNGTYLALCWQTGGGGAAAVLRLTDRGKNNEVALFEGHSGPVLDVAFSPFNQSIFASASEDSTIKIWQINDDSFGKKTCESSQVLSGHNRKAGSVNFHPVANNVLATTSIDLKVKIWDIEVGKEMFTVDNQHSANIQSLDWNYDGSLLTTFCKDKFIRVIDPRSSKVATEININSGVKGGRVIWLGSKNMLLFAGFNRNSERVMRAWSANNYSDCVYESVIDNSSGILMPFWDDSSSIVFLAGKGDGNIRYYEFDQAANTFHFLSQYSSTNPQSGAAFLPKFYVDVSLNEIDRIYRVMPNNTVEPISFIVPRKSKDFQKDLYSEVAGATPALTAAQWAANSNSNPTMIDLESGYRPPVDAQVQFVKSAPNEENAEPTMTEAEMRDEIKRLTQRVTFLESEIAKRDVKLKKFSQQ